MTNTPLNRQYESILGFQVDSATPRLTKRRLVRRIIEARTLLGQYDHMMNRRGEFLIGVELSPLEHSVSGTRSYPLVPEGTMPLGIHCPNPSLRHINHLRRMHTAGGQQGLIPFPYGNLDDKTKKYLEIGNHEAYELVDCEFYLALPQIDITGMPRSDPGIVVFQKTVDKKSGQLLYDDITHLFDSPMLDIKREFRMIGNLSSLVEVFDDGYRIDYRPLQSTDNGLHKPNSPEDYRRNGKRAPEDYGPHSMLQAA